MKAEIGYQIKNFQTGYYLQTNLMVMGHLQPSTLVEIENSVFLY